MKISDYQQFEYNCQDTQELLAFYLTCPEELTFDERDGVDQHLAQCDFCRQNYEGMELVANQANLPDCRVLNHNFPPEQFNGEMSHEDIMDQRFQDRLQRSLIRRKRRQRRENIARFKRLVKPISTIAACLVMGLGVFFAVNQLNWDNESMSPVASNQQDLLKIEVISDDTTEIVLAGQLIAAADEIKTLRINGNRQMVLNVGTKLSIEPYSLGCLVKLDQGEIYTEVEHDGKSFIVETSQGRAVITGTTFNIKANPDKMNLAVVEGSVRFESEKGSVDVVGGYQSLIVTDMKPEKPIACDVLQITKWAKEQSTDTIAVDIPAKTTISELATLPLIKMSYCDMEDINFNVWIDQHRVWFEREFSWTKRLQKLFSSNGIEVDTIDLLIESGDLWRFAWPEHSQQTMLAEDRRVIQKIVNRYDIGIDELLLTNAVQDKQSTNVEAFEKWLDAFGADQGNVTVNSIHAVSFLIKTRSLVYHAIDSDKVVVEDKQQVLDLLAEQVKTASDLLGTLNQMLLTDEDQAVCLTPQYAECVAKIKNDILLITEIEQGLTGNEIIIK